ncbi:MAG: DUF2256 domain-containing protein [Pseudomonadota bacterium]|nr:DUF2256 domain-containing protein [Pseudomonadota bacterium]
MSRSLLHAVKNTTVTHKQTFKGNKQSLPSKPCQCCGRDMTWRKAWAKNWEHVLYCSDACRKNKSRLSSSNDDQTL